MKHLYICTAVFTFIVAGSLFSCKYTTKQVNTLKSDISQYSEIQQFADDDINAIENIKEHFFANKNMLQLFINKEHIHELEINILMMETSVKNNETDSCRQNSIEAVAILEQIQEYSTAID